jgi:hypothetical protein
MSIEYIFSINTGRSGSDYLTELFAQADNAVSIHEGVPIMNGAPMVAFNNGNPAVLRALMPRKMAEIATKKKSASTIYCETNHSYIKGWGYLLPDAYIPQEQIAVVILRRDPEKIAQSLLRIHNVPGATTWTRTWWLTPGASSNLSAPPPGASPLDLCRWYVAETELRAQDYQRRFPRITYIECNLEQLNDIRFVSSMFIDLGLKPGADLATVCGKPLNSMSEWPPLNLTRPVANLPSADQLSASEAKALVARMIDYLKTRKSQQLSALRSDHAGENSLAPAVAGFVARIGPELESQFGMALCNTEVESALVWTLLSAVDRLDLLLFFAKQKGQDGPYYDFDFNVVPSLPRLAKRFGLAILPRLLRLAAQKKRLTDDRSHRRLRASP